MVYFFVIFYRKYSIITLLSSALRVGGGDFMKIIVDFILGVAVEVVGNYLYKWLNSKRTKEDDN